MARGRRAVAKPARPRRAQRGRGGEADRRGLTPGRGPPGPIRTVACTVVGVPMYIDRHDAPGVSPEELAEAHRLDVAVQEQARRAVPHLLVRPGQRHGVLPRRGPEPTGRRGRAPRSARPAGATIIELDPDASAERVLRCAAAVIRSGPPYTAPAMRAIVFTDVCGSVAQTHELGDDGHMQLLGEHNEIVRAQLDAHDGREVKHTGDGIMAAFTSVVAAVDVRGRRATRRSTSATRRRRPPLHVSIGISAGEPVTDDNDDLFGAAVQLAARLCAAAGPATSPCRSLCASSASASHSASTTAASSTSRVCPNPPGPTAWPGASSSPRPIAPTWRSAGATRRRRRPRRLRGCRRRRARRAPRPRPRVLRAPGAASARRRSRSSAPPRSRATGRARARRRPRPARRLRTAPTRSAATAPGVVAPATTNTSASIGASAHTSCRLGAELVVGEVRDRLVDRGAGAAVAERRVRERRGADALRRRRPRRSSARSTSGQSRPIPAARIRADHSRARMLSSLAANDGTSASTRGSPRWRSQMSSAMRSTPAGADARSDGQHLEHAVVGDPGDEVASGRNRSRRTNGRMRPRRRARTDRRRTRRSTSAVAASIVVVEIHHVRPGDAGRRSPTPGTSGRSGR